MLILKVCSAVHMNCLPAMNDSFVFNSWSECASAGYLRSIKIINSMDSNVVNANKIVVNFKCVQTEELQENIMDKMLQVFIEEITMFWNKIKNGIKNKIKKIVCKCKCTKEN